MKQFFYLSFLLLMVFSLAACGSSESNSKTKDNSDNATKSEESTDADYVLKFADVVDDEHTTNKAAYWMADKLEERTDGKVQMEVYSNSQLGGAEEQISGMKAGDIDLSWVSTGQMTDYVPEFNLFSVPYLIKNEEHYDATVDADSEVMEEINSYIDDTDMGSRLVGMMGGSTRNLYNSKHPVETADDLNGLKIRIQDSSVEGEVWKKFGAEPTPLSADEVYTALQSDVIDGRESSVDQYYTDKFYEEAKYLSLTEHQFLFLPVLMSDKTYDELPEDLRDIVLDTVQEASEKTWEDYRKSDEEVMSKLEDLDVTITDPDKDTFKEKIDSLDDEVAEEYGAENLLKLVKQTNN